MTIDKIKTAQRGNPRARQGVFTPCVTGSSLLKNQRAAAGAMAGQEFFISDGDFFQTLPQPKSPPQLKIFWNATIEFAPKFFRGKISELRINRIKNKQPRRKDASGR